MRDSDQSVVKSADRVFELLELLAPRTEGLSHTVIADSLGIPKSSLTQLLKTATARGYVSFDTNHKTYTLGGKLGQLSRRTSPVQELLLHADATLEEVTARTRESSALNVLKGDYAEVVASFQSPQRLTSHMRQGDLAPLYATSGGKILLAHLPADEIEDYTGRVTLEAITPNTVSSFDELRRELAKVREDGVAYSYEEFTPGIVGMATVVLSVTGLPLASVNIAIPAIRYNNRLQVSALEALRYASAKLQTRVQL